jgi:hypothetical protein
MSDFIVQFHLWRHRYISAFPDRETCDSGDTPFARWLYGSSGAGEVVTVDPMMQAV